MEHHATTQPARRVRPGPARPEYVMPTNETRILVVDDLPEKLLAYKAVLEDLDLTVVTARSGDEALSLLLKYEFAVILLDVQMPGMTGLELAEMIRRRRRSAQTPIIFLTAFDDEVKVAEGYAHGAVDFILTPAVPEILRAKVKVFVDLYRMNQQVRRQAEERVALFEERARRAAAEEANRRLAFLAEASRVLAGSLDPQSIARAIARLAVPTLAEIGGVTLTEDPSHPLQTKLVWVEPGAEVKARWLTGVTNPCDLLQESIARSLKSGQPVRLADLDLPPEFCLGQPVAMDGRIRSVAVFPLLARGRTLGALTLAFGPNRRSDPSDFATAADLASRAAVALDNARLYHEIQLADRNKNQFLATLGHELRNPLAPVRNGLTILRTITGGGEAVAATLSMIDRQVGHLVRLIDDLMDISRITRGKMVLQRDRLDLRSAVDTALEASRNHVEAGKHTLTVDAESGSYPVLGDLTRLAQVFTNLLNNAAKYTPDGGRIRVELSRAGGQAVVRVSDTGVGMDAKVIGIVFDMFTQVGTGIDRAQGGLGIGLTLVRQIVDLHGGTVEAESPGAGLGSTFTVRLQLVD
jgi:signal transduction histidine kinase/DNA-binding response OmpR family regulator